MNVAGTPASQIVRPTVAHLPGRILVVDDDPIHRELMELVLSDEGCEVRCVPNGAPALALVQTWNPDLILIDLWMPNLDGPSFARAYRELPGPHAPLILVTASFVDPTVVEQMGAVARIDKPFDLEQLLAVVDEYAPCAAA
jgi:CheY-like chemotaxis protein